MHPADIVAALRKSGSGVVQVAKELGIYPGSVSGVISGRDSSRRVAKKISSVTKIPVSVLWPGRYEPTPRSKFDRGARRLRQTGVAVSG